MNEDALIKYKNLVDSLKLIALDYEEQVKSLPDFVHVPDEIALTFDEAFLRRRVLVEERLISEEALKMLTELDKLFEVMSQDKSLWDNKKLKESIEWQLTRSHARTILDILGEDLTRPDFDNIDWIN